MDHGFVDHAPCIMYHVSWIRRPAPCTRIYGSRTAPHTSYHPAVSIKTLQSTTTGLAPTTHSCKLQSHHLPLQSASVRGRCTHAGHGHTMPIPTSLQQVPGSRIDDFDILMHNIHSHSVFVVEGMLCKSDKPYIIISSSTQPLVLLLLFVFTQPLVFLLLFIITQPITRALLNRTRAGQHALCSGQGQGRVGPHALRSG